MLLCSRDGARIEIILGVPLPQVRPMISTAPFSTELVMDRHTIGPLATKYFILPMHVSLSFIRTRWVTIMIHYVTSISYQAHRCSPRPVIITVFIAIVVLSYLWSS
jgi:hypothetical protein